MVRCEQCNKKLGINDFKCRCGKILVLMILNVDVVKYSVLSIYKLNSMIVSLITKQKLKQNLKKKCILDHLEQK
jgi:hypothetical protein